MMVGSGRDDVELSSLLCLNVGQRPAVLAGRKVGGVVRVGLGLFGCFSLAYSISLFRLLVF